MFRFCSLIIYYTLSSSYTTIHTQTHTIKRKCSFYNIRQLSVITAYNSRKKSLSVNKELERPKKNRHELIYSRVFKYDPPTHNCNLVHSISSIRSGKRAIFKFCRMGNVIIQFSVSVIITTAGLFLGPTARAHVSISHLAVSVFPRLAGACISRDKACSI